MGGARHRDHRRHLHRGARDRVVRAVRDRRHGDPDRACAATPRHGSSAASTPTASTVASPASSSCSARRARSWWCTPERSTPAPRPSRRASGAAPCASPRSTASSAPTSSAGDLARLLDPIGYTVDGAGDRRGRRVAVVATGLDRGDRRHRGGRAPLRLRQHRAQRVPRSPLHGRLSERQQRRRRLRQVLLGLGSRRRCRTRSCPPSS